MDKHPSTQLAEALVEALESVLAFHDRNILVTEEDVSRLRRTIALAKELLELQ